MQRIKIVGGRITDIEGDLERVDTGTLRLWLQQEGEHLEKLTAAGSELANRERSEGGESVLERLAAVGTQHAKRGASPLEQIKAVAAEATKIANELRARRGALTVETCVLAPDGMALAGNTYLEKVRELECVEKKLAAAVFQSARMTDAEFELHNRDQEVEEA